MRVLLGYSKNSKERVQKLVKQLTDNEYLLADCVPTKKAKSPYYYFLARRGRQYCEALGLDIHAYFRPSSEKVLSSPFLNHTLSLNDVVISAVRLTHHTPEYALSSFMHERVLKQSPYKGTVLLPDGTQQTFTVIPDAVFDFRQQRDKGKERKSVVLYEHDMGTTEQKHFRRKIRAYLGFLKSGVYKDLLGVKHLVIAFGTPMGDNRKTQMCDWTRKELASTSEPKWLANVFFFAALPAQLHPLEVWRKPLWYLPFDDMTGRSLLA
jgi:Replication-relaxation